MLKAAAAGIAAACGWKAAKAEIGGTLAHDLPVDETLFTEGLNRAHRYCEMFNQGEMTRNDARLLEIRKFRVEDVHGSFECIVTLHGTTWRAV